MSLYFNYTHLSKTLSFLVKHIESRGDSRQVERRFFVLTTFGIYSDKIILFMLWLFDTRRGFLVQEYIPEFEAINHEDLLGFQRREEGENVTNRRKRNLSNKRIGIKKMTRQLVDEISLQ